MLFTPLISSLTMSIECTYCDTQVEDLAGHMLADHEEELRAHRMVNSKRLMQRLCRICYTPSRNLYSHLENNHVESVTVTIADRPLVYSRGEGRMFHCPHCSGRFRNSGIFKVSWIAGGTVA